MEVAAHPTSERLEAFLVAAAGLAFLLVVVVRQEEVVGLQARRQAVHQEGASSPLQEAEHQAFREAFVAAFRVVAAAYSRSGRALIACLRLQEGEQI